LSIRHTSHVSNIGSATRRVNNHINNYDGLVTNDDGPRSIRLADVAIANDDVAIADVSIANDDAAIADAGPGPACGDAGCDPACC
jgi:hypothetical protein